MSKKRIQLALYGGSFDPFHVGHMAVITYAMAVLNPSDLWVVPCWEHAFDKKLTPYHHRYQMLNAALGAVFRDNVSVSTIEKTKKARYTIDVVEAIYKVRDDVIITLVIGEDAYEERHSWHRWDDLISKVFVFPVDRMGVGGGSRELFPVGAPVPRMPEVSSTLIRRLLAEGRLKEAIPLLPTPVLDYINKHKLYGVSE